ncbi:MAG: 4-hydroxythreonine-4-phosphate dehydrogenase PdxA [Planctomycetes bacterium]|nr:4-hydroxythreonine-4-phosphate dehydrogenase PdxA [Planctomycetota bacterium]
MTFRPILAITQGDPLGIGPEVLLRALADGAAGHAEVIVLADEALLAETARRLGLAMPDRMVDSPVKGPASALWALEEACRLARPAHGAPRRVDAIVTAPIHKADLVRVGFTFPGQTEFLGDRLGGVETTMLLAGDTLRVALVTTHVRLLDVPRVVTTERVMATIRRLHAGLREAYGIERPRLAVLGLNPHAGEEGLFGPEDDAVVRPAVVACAAEGIDCRGPLPGDGTFAPRARAAFDGFVAMYHDQGLAALKAVEGGNAVNVTLGLPVPRTSPDHGTARDIAGRGIADAASMAAAIRLAASWAARRVGG